jgi:hypothetical protein
MITNTGLPAWPTTSDEEEGRLHRRTRGCCPGRPRTAGESQGHHPAPARSGGDGANRPTTSHHRCAADGRQGRPQHSGHRRPFFLRPPPPRHHTGWRRSTAAAVEGMTQPPSHPRQEGKPPPLPRPEVFAPAALPAAAGGGGLGLGLGAARVGRGWGFSQTLSRSWPDLRTIVCNILYSCPIYNLTNIICMCTTNKYKNMPIPYLYEYGNHS